MNVGFDVTPIEPRRSGIGRYTYELLRALWAEYPREHIQPIGNRRVAPADLPPAAPGTPRFVAGPRAPFRMAWMLGPLPAWLPRSGLDLCHFTNFYAPVAGNTPYVVTFHDMSTLLLADAHPRRRVTTSRATLARVARRAAALITVSEASRADLLRVLDVPPGRIHVVHEAPSPLFAPVADEERLRALAARYRLEPGFLLYVGTVEPRKNLARVIEAVALERERGRRVDLVVVGRLGWKYAPILDRVRELQLGDRVRFLGFVPDDDLPALMALARGLVYASLYEGFGLPILEAMAAGAPVITSNRGAMAEVAGDAALLVDPEDTTAIAAAIARLSADRALAHEFRCRGIERAARFSWVRAAHETFAIYQAARAATVRETQPASRPEPRAPALVRAGLDALPAATLEPIAYGDVFHYPLTAAEVHRYLPVPAVPAEVTAALADLVARGLVVRHRGFFTLPGREDTVVRRLHRAAAARALWPRALRYGRAIALLPFVRMVAVTGSLAVDNVEPGSDVDYMVVTEDGRLWLSRALSLGVVHAAAGLGNLELCPNYFVGRSALELAERNRFTARELVQMVPVAGFATYRELLDRNSWYREWLPNAAPRPVVAGGGPRLLQRLGEPLLALPPLDRVERWEMRRKAARLARANPPSAEVQLDAAHCKGHFEAHGNRVLRAFEARLAAIEERLVDARTAGSTP